MTSNPSAESTRARLIYRWRRDGRRETFEALLNRYFLERLLYRLGRSPHRDRFILKGALLFAHWNNAPHQATRDIDLLGYGDPDPEGIAATFRDICASGGDDGVEFRADTALAVREDAVYAGVRVTIEAHLGQARQNLQIDIGFGDAVVPSKIKIAAPVVFLSGRTGRRSAIAVIAILRDNHRHNRQGRSVDYGDERPPIRERDAVLGG